VRAKEEMLQEALALNDRDRKAGSAEPNRETYLSRKYAEFYALMLNDG